MTEQWFEVVDKEQVFEFLDDLRESGVTNMFGAGSYIQDRYPKLDRRQSRVALQDWMKSFGERHSV